MRSSSKNSAFGNYEPANIELPPLYSRPLRIAPALRYLFFDILFPLGFMYLAVAFPIWWYFTPPVETMAVFSPDWIALLWLRNCILLCLFAGGLHWWLHLKKQQGGFYRMNRKALATDPKAFLWGNQIKDNIFWSIASGVTIWTGYEAISYWIYASGRLPIVDNLWWGMASVYVLFFWSTLNFYVGHRFLHWRPMYQSVHSLHHRNVDIGPWSGISMHPIEHLLYFSPFVLWWFIPVHPIIIIVTGLYQALNPTVTHSGFEYLQLGSKFKVKIGDWYHQLHHQYFNLNYGNTFLPIDKWMGSWHDGSEESLHTQKARFRKRSIG
mgnify:FL=1